MFMDITGIDLFDLNVGMVCAKVDEVFYAVLEWKNRRKSTLQTLLRSPTKNYMYTVQLLI